MPPHPKRVSLRLDMGRVQLAMEKVAKHDGIMVVHAEDDDLGGELFVIELSHLSFVEGPRR
jgi:dihydroorotase-like cyclic amidohydrolase